MHPSFAEFYLWLANDGQVYQQSDFFPFQAERSSFLTLQLSAGGTQPQPLSSYSFAGHQLSSKLELLLCDTFPPTLLPSGDDKLWPF